MGFVDLDERNNFAVDKFTLGWFIFRVISKFAGTVAIIRFYRENLRYCRHNPVLS